MWELLTLSNYSALLEAALDTNYIRPADLDTPQRVAQGSRQRVPATRNN